MTEIQKKNETKLFEAIQSLKDSIFGLNNLYVDYCYATSEDGDYCLSHSNVELFITTLVSYALSTEENKDNWKQILTDFYYLAIHFIAITCRFDDQKFISIRKIANTVYKDSLDAKSTFDIMIEQATEEFEEEFLSTYDRFSKTLINIDQRAFYGFVKKSLEDYIDAHNLNCLNDDSLTDSFVFRIKRLSKHIDIDSSRNKR